MSRTTRTITGVKAKKAILDGVNAIYKPTALTLGPEGKNALLFRTFNRGSRITNDGKTVAGTQVPKNPFVRSVAETFYEACKRTDEIVGDSTTTTTVIGGKLYNDIYRILSEGQSSSIAKQTGVIGAMTLKKKILESAKFVKDEIKKSAKKIESLEDLEKIAIISVEDEELGKIIAKMAWEVGVDGYIDTVEGYKGEIETEIIKGMRFPAKIAAKAFVNNPSKFEMVANDCPVILTNHSIDVLADIVPVLQNANKVTSKIIILAPSFSENVLIDWVNATKQGFFIYPVKTPSLREDQYEDIAVYTGARFINKNKGHSLRSITNNDLGFLERLVVKDTETKEDAVAIGGKGTQEETLTEVSLEEKNGKKEKIFNERKTTKIAEHIRVLKGKLEETPQDIFKKVLQRRIASMASAVGVIRVGDSTQASALYRKLKIEDAVYSCKAALRGGYVEGGGLCLKKIADKMSDDDILKSAIAEPYEVIQASIEGGVEITDDVIDSMEGMYYAVEHSTKVVASLATVDIITIEEEDPLPEEGNFAIAKMIGELVLSTKRHYGQMKENEDEAERDRMNALTQGLTIEEWSGQDNG